jgi:excisionase family DNA binding protein
MTDKLLCSPREAAELLGVGRTQMAEMIGRCEIESVKIGRLRKIPREALTVYVDRLRAAAAPERTATREELAEDNARTERARARRAVRA